MHQKNQTHLPPDAEKITEDIWCGKDSYSCAGTGKKKLDFPIIMPEMLECVSVDREKMILAVLGQHI
jgi:hypothetical protein